MSADCERCGGTGRYRDPRYWGTMPGSTACPDCDDATERTCCAGCGDIDPEHWREGGWYCTGCASCEVCDSPYCTEPGHVL